MSRPTPRCASLAALTLAILSAPAPVAAQEPPPPAAARAAEVKELEAMLARVDEALRRLEPAARPPVTLALYDVRLLLARPEERAAPSLALGRALGYRTGKGAGGGGVLSFAGADDEQEGGLLSADKLVELARATLPDDAWEAPCSIEVHGGQLFVRQTALGQALVRRLLDQLAGRELRSVQLELGIYRLTPAARRQLEEGSGGSSRISPEALLQLERAVAAKEAHIVRSALLTALDGQRVYLHQGAEQAFVSDIERCSGGTGSVVETVADPVVQVLRTGLTLEVRPSLAQSEAEPLVALDLRVSRATLLTIDRRVTPWGEVDVPRVDTETVRTAARIPPGGGVLVFASQGEAKDAKGASIAVIVRPRVVAPK